VADVVAGVRDVGFRYATDGPWILRDISLDLTEGKITAVLGPNGAGKSTLARLLMGESEAQAGRVDMQCPPDRRIMRYQVFDKNLLPWYSVERNLALCGGNETGDALAPWIELAGLEQWHRGPVRDLSGGQRQILSILAVLSLRPLLLILDEPFSAIDPGRTPRFWHLLRGWTADHRAAVMVITHNVDEAVALGDDVAVLRGPPVNRITVEPVDRRAFPTGAFAPEALTPFRERVLRRLYAPVD
jgi:ABC-type nitrate/sulfonate/bicarbonate transport system ATPase subunit